MSALNVLVVGAGAVGGFFGARLVDAGIDTTFLVRQRRAEQLESHGLEIRDQDGTATDRKIRTVTAPNLRENYDLILLATKATSLETTLDDVAPAVGPATAILPMMNGVKHIDSLTDHFGSACVLGGVALLGTELQSNGAIHQLTPAATISFGELDGRRTERLDTIAATFAPANFRTILAEDIEQEMWDKWFFMAAGGTANILLGDFAASIADSGNEPNPVENIVDEISAVFDVAGHPIRQEVRERVIRTITAPGKPFTTSLYRDFAAGRPGEVEPILGDLIELAASQRLPTPSVSAAATRIRQFESDRTTR